MLYPGAKVGAIGLKYLNGRLGQCDRKVSGTAASLVDPGIKFGVSH
jgi:hypothetical protein